MLASELGKGDVVELTHRLDNQPILCTIYGLESHDSNVIITFEGVWNSGFSGIHHLQSNQKVNAIPMKTLLQQKLG
ncbi:TPA: hypothetical protein QC181_005186 [Bacillus cereus]|nr:hypothetical protein [Bacillus cereus]